MLFFVPNNVAKQDINKNQQENMNTCSYYFTLHGYSAFKLRNIQIIYVFRLEIIVYKARCVMQTNLHKHFVELYRFGVCINLSNFTFK